MLKRQTIWKLGRALRIMPRWLLLLLFAGLLFMPVKYVYFNSDGVEYIGQALNVSKGFGLVGLDQTTAFPSRILTPLYVASVFLLSGASDMSAFIALRVFFLLNTLLVYFLAARLFDKNTGLLAGLLVLTSFSMNEWQTIINLDYFLAFALLLSIYLLYVSFDRKSPLFFALTGLSMACSFLVKETAAVIFALPVVMWLAVAEYRNRKAILWIGVLYLALGLILLCWLLYGISITSSWQLLLGNQGQSVLSAGTAGSSTLSGLAANRLNLLAAFLTYYQSQLVPNFYYAPLFILAVGYLIVEVLSGRNRRGSLILLATFVPFIPIIVYQGRFGFRATQAMIVFFLFYIALARCVSVAIGGTVSVVSGLAKPFKWPERPYWRMGITGFLVLLVLLIQAFERQVDYDGRPRLELFRVGRGNIVNHVERFNTLAYLLNHDNIEWKTDLEWSNTAAEWMKENIPEGSSLLTNNIYMSRAIYWKTRAQFPVHGIPWRTTSLVNRVSNSDASATTAPPLFVRLGDENQKVVESSWDQKQLTFLVEEDLLEAVKTYGAEYIVLGPYAYELSYFMSNPSFELVKDFGPVQIFRVRNLAPTGTKPLTGFVGDTIMQLQELQRDHPMEYEKLKREVLENELALDPQLLANAVNGTVDPTPLVYSLSEFMSDVAAHQVADHLLAANATPENPLASSPWALVVNGQLLGIAGKFDASLDAFAAAVDRAGADDRLYSTILETVKSKLNMYDVLPTWESFIAQLESKTCDEFPAASSCTLVARLYGLSDSDAAMIRVYEHAAEKWPDNVDLLRGLTDAYQKVGRTKDAATTLQKLLVLTPNDNDLYRELLSIYLQSGNTVAAENLVKSAIQQNPNAAWTQLMAGEYYLHVFVSDKMVTP